MADLFQLPKVVSLPGSKLYFYQTGTTTPQNTYQDAALTTPHANPVVADAAGVFAPIYLDSSLPNYRVRHETSASVLIYQVDDVLSSQAAGTSLRLSSTDPFLILHDTNGTTDQRKYKFRVSGAAFEITGLNDAETTEDTFFSYGGAAPSFTATLSSFSTTVTGTVYYRRTGKHVTLWLESNVFGTSTDANLVMTGLPSIIQPTAQKIVPCSELVDGGFPYAGAAAINGSSIQFARYAVSGSYIRADGAFTASGQKGLNTGWSVSYPVS